MVAPQLVDHSAYSPSHPSAILAHRHSGLIVFGFHHHTFWSTEMCTRKFFCQKHLTFKTCCALCACVCVCVCVCVRERERERESVCLLLVQLILQMPSKMTTVHLSEYFHITSVTELTWQFSPTFARLHICWNMWWWLIYLGAEKRLLRSLCTVHHLYEVLGRVFGSNSLPWLTQ
jgi:hypothetical protein